MAVAVASAVGCASSQHETTPAPTTPRIAERPSTPEPPLAPEPVRAPTPQPAPAPEPVPAPAATAPTAPPPSPIVRLAHGIEVDRAARRVTVPARVATTHGYLEQVVCGTDSREHESLLVVEAKASEVHAALLLAGATPGQPGRWRLDGTTVVSDPPSGSPVAVRVRYRAPADESGESSPWIERPITEWIRGTNGASFDGHWVFAGSRFAQNPRSWKRPGEHYIADYTGSIVGLVTFGDETVAATAVIPDLLEVAAANWEAWTSRMPAPDSEAILILELVETPTTTSPPAPSASSATNPAHLSPG